MNRGASEGCHAATAGKSRRVAGGPAMLVVAAGLLGTCCGCGQRAADPTPAAPEAPATSTYAVLHGQWQRPDGGYVLAISGAAEDGELAAAYYNPRPIHVARAQASREDGVLRVTIELQDVGYPGSTYRLIYDPAADRLHGTYFQAVAGETYEIVFGRLAP